MRDRTWPLIAGGFALIAVCYGFARFAFGLFLPAIAAELSLSASFSGLIAGGSFFGYCVAILVSARLTERIGPRGVAVLAAGIAALGMAGIALAPNGVALGAAVLFAGMSTGLASPPLAAAVALRIAPTAQERANSIINAGTSAGVALSAPAALFPGSDWRLCFAGFAGFALVETGVVLLVVPKGKGAAKRPLRPFFTPDLKRLSLAAFLTGAASTAIWSFGGSIIAQTLGWSGARIGYLWFVIGVFGLVGSGCGSVVRRFGLISTHRTALLMAAFAIAMLGLLPSPLAAMAAGGLFGAAYIGLTSVYLLWGVAALPDRPATGLTIGFLALAAGQVAGAPLFGALLEQCGVAASSVVFALLALSPLFVRRRP